MSTPRCGFGRIRKMGDGRYRRAVMAEMGRLTGSRCTVLMSRAKARSRMGGSDWPRGEARF